MLCDVPWTVTAARKAAVVTPPPCLLPDETEVAKHVHISNSVRFDSIKVSFEILQSRDGRCHRSIRPCTPEPTQLKAASDIPSASHPSLGLDTPAGPWSGGNLIDICLSGSDAIRLINLGVDGLPVANTSNTKSRAFKELFANDGYQPLVEATCFFTFPAIGSTDGAGIIQTAETLGFVDGSCNFGFRCIVPECPYVSSEPDITMLAQVHVQALVSSKATESTRTVPMDVNGDSDGGDRVFFIEDANVSGGYLYLGKDRMQRAQDALLFMQEVRVLQSTTAHEDVPGRWTGRLARCSAASAGRGGATSEIAAGAEKIAAGTCAPAETASDPVPLGPGIGEHGEIGDWVAPRRQKRQRSSASAN
jgi:hypothetical protein